MIEVPAPHASPRLSEGRIHVWPVWLWASERDVASTEAALSPRERRRAGTFRFTHLRRNFLLRHGCQRALLGRYLDTAANEVPIKVQANGKPCLESADPDLRFNLSSSGDFAVFAFALGRELGVDIELVRPRQDLELLALQSFAREETDDWLGLPPEHRESAFFTAWTRKEAYLKAVGEGLLAPLNRVRVTLRPDEAPSLVHIGGNRCAARHWHLYSLEPAQGYTGAVAYAGDAMEVRVFTTATASDILAGAVPGA